MFNNCYQNKKVLVTGHTGFKGSWLTAWLQELGAKIVGIALEPDSEPSHFTLLQPQIESHICDIRDQAKLQQIIRCSQPEIIFHLAAQPLVRESYQSPLATFATNTMGTANLLESCRGSAVLKAIVVITTDKCYENCEEQDRSYAENDPLGGYDPYSASKAAAEIVVASYRNSFFNIEQYGNEHQTLIATARAGNVIGGGDWAKDRLIPDIVRATARSKKVIIRNPSSTRPWQHVLDCLSGYLVLGEKLLQGESRFAESWNFAPNRSAAVSVLSIVQKMQELWPRVAFEIQYSLNAPHEAHYLQLDATKANAQLDWRAVWNIDTALRATIEWYREFYDSHQLMTLANIKRYSQDAEKQGINQLELKLAAA